MNNMNYPQKQGKQTKRQRRAERKAVAIRKEAFFEMAQQKEAEEDKRDQEWLERSNRYPGC